ncbi:MAG: hypothetical protein KKF56_01955 [Nanoarchaeota archaeon]|nr:hypothetical protein [Nanoarchaeota archaeon]
MNVGHNGLPVLQVEGESIPEAWERSIVELNNNGYWYRREDPKDEGKMQVDSRMTIVIANPDSQLLAHKSMTAGLEDLFEYEMEIMGAKNSWIKDLNDPDDTKWDYLYNERFTGYPTDEGVPLDQLKYIVEALAKRPTTRKAQGITWVPERDTITKDTPCLQRIWFGITPSDDGPVLGMDYEFRSRNPMIAAVMNMHGMHTLQCHVRDGINERTGMGLRNGRMVDSNNSYHVTAKNQQLLQGFLERLKASQGRGEGIEHRAFDRTFVQDYVDSVRAEVIKKVVAQTGNYMKGPEFEAEAAKIRRIGQEVGHYVPRGDVDGSD